MTELSMVGNGVAIGAAAGFVAANGYILLNEACCGRQVSAPAESVRGCWGWFTMGTGSSKSYYVFSNVLGTIGGAICGGVLGKVKASYVGDGVYHHSGVYIIPAVIGISLVFLAAVYGEQGNNAAHHAGYRVAAQRPRDGEV